MMINAKIINLADYDEPTFSIIEEFAHLNPNRKLALCDDLFTRGRNAFQNAVRLLWPDARQTDVKKLESFITLLKAAAH